MPSASSARRRARDGRGCGRAGGREARRSSRRARRSRASPPSRPRSGRRRRPRLASGRLRALSIEPESSRRRRVHVRRVEPRDPRRPVRQPRREHDRVRDDLDLARRRAVRDAGRRRRRSRRDGRSRGRRAALVREERRARRLASAFFVSGGRSTGSRARSAADGCRAARAARRRRSRRRRCRRSRPRLSRDARPRPGRRRRASGTSDGLVGRPLERLTGGEVEERAVARAADRRSLDPAVGQRALGVRAPGLDRMPRAVDAGEREQRVSDSSAPTTVSSGATRSPASIQVMRPSGTWRCCGARNSQPSNTGGRSGSRRRPGRRSSSRVERDPHLNAGEVVARAEVRPEAERGVVPPRPEEVERVGRRPPDVLVAVGGRDEQAEVRTGGDGDAAELGVDERAPGLRPDRRDPAKAFLDGVADERWGRRRPRRAAATRAGRRASSPPRARAPASRRGGSP